MKTSLASVLVIGFISAISCSPTVDTQEVVSANNLFSASVYKEVLKKHANENFIVSPFSAEAVLSLTQAGAKGETAQELRSALRLPNDHSKIENQFKALLPTLKNNEQYTLNSANKIYLKNGYSIDENYKKTATDVYHSAIEGIDFIPETKAAETINKWVEEQTNNKIQNLLSPEVLDADTRLVLVNALHFKGNWSTQFEDYLTSKGDFYTTSKDVVQVDTMRVDDYFHYYESPEVKAKFLELPFVGGDASVVIVLPTEKEGLSSLESQIDKMFLQPKFTNEYVNVKIPKFQIDTEIDFAEILQHLGVKKAFDAGQADFSGISGKPGDLSISAVVQKAFVELNEYGAEAAAATYVAMVDIMALNEPEPKQFHADHPFIFYFKAKDLILFVGKVVLPKTQ